MVLVFLMNVVWVFNYSFTMTFLSFEITELLKTPGHKLLMITNYLKSVPKNWGLAKYCEGLLNNIYFEFSKVEIKF